MARNVLSLLRVCLKVARRNILYDFSSRDDEKRKEEKLKRGIGGISNLKLFRPFN